MHMARISRALLCLAVCGFASAAFPAPFVYVGNSANASVSVIDAATNTVVKTIAVFGGPSDIAVSADERRVYVAYGHGVAIIDAATQAVIGTIAVPGATAIALSPEGRWLYAVDGDLAAPVVSRIDVVRGIVSGSVEVDPHASSLAVSRDGNSLVSSHNGSTTSERGITKIDPMAMGILSRNYDIDPVTKAIYDVANTDLIIAAVDTRVDFSYGSGSDSATLPGTIGDIARWGNTLVMATIPAINSVAAVDSPFFHNPPVLTPLTGQPARVAPEWATSRIYVTEPLGGKTWVLDGTTFAVQGTIAVGVGPIAVAARPKLPRRLRHGRDFDASGTIDLLLRKTGTSAIYELNTNGFFNTEGTATLVVNDPHLTPTHTGFFHINSHAGILWRNTFTGATELTIDGTQFCCGSGRMQRVILTDPSWQVEAVADLNGDGFDDILWRNATTGQSAIWLMTDFDTIDTIALPAPAQWQVTHTGDFNGDGVADLVWRNSATGETAIWLMSNGRFASGAIVLARPEWGVALVGDFDGDGKSDLVWRNNATGETAIWLMDGTTMVSGAIVVTSIEWAPTHVGDFNGDGKSDLLWHNANTGATNVWLMNGLAFAGANLLTDSQWFVVEVGDHDGDGKDDIIWLNGATGYTAMWLMNGLAPSVSSNPFTTMYDILP